MTKHPFTVSLGLYGDDGRLLFSGLPIELAKLSYLNNARTELFVDAQMEGFDGLADLLEPLSVPYARTALNRSGNTATLRQRFTAPDGTKCRADFIIKRVRCPNCGAPTHDKGEWR